MKEKIGSQAGLKNRFFKKMPALLPLLFLVVLIGLIIGLSGTIQAEKERIAEEKREAITAEQPAANVVLLDVAPTTIHDRINLPGVIEPWNRLNLLARINGTVTEIKVSEGDTVQEGQVLALLDPADYEIAVDSAKASFELAVANQKRLAALFAKGIIPRAEIDKLEAEVKTSRARLENAQLMLSRCTITAPISGVIRRLDAKQGLLLNIADPVAEILQIDKVKAVVGIPESDVAQIRAVDTVKLTIQALDNKEITGRTHFLASSPENDARLYRLELAIDNDDHLILPGMFFRAHIIKETFKDATVVPLYTVIKRENRQFVFVEENGAARLRPVELGIIEGWRVQIADGLLPGDRVVIEGHRDIDEGRRLNVVKVFSDPKEAVL
jgi:membrane fusion protein (multidrug efflux system)